MKLVRPLLLALVVFTTLIFPTRSVRAESSPPTVAGSFRYAGTANEEIGRKVAIDKAIDSLFFAIRPIARSRLSNGTKIDPTVVIAFDAGKIRVKVPSGPEAISPESGAVVDFVADGEKSKLSQRASNGTKLTQVFQAEEGRRQNEWLLAPDGSTLTLRVTVSSPKLSTALVYTLTYKRS